MINLSEFRKLVAEMRAFADATNKAQPVTICKWVDRLEAIIVQSSVEWALVPREPTEAMIQAIHDATFTAPPDGDYHGEPTVSAHAIYVHQYKAMLAACTVAPRPAP